MRRVLMVVAVVSAAWAARTQAQQEIGFVEEFGLAEDRTAPLATLIPGTEDYYFYHCLHNQNARQFDEARKLLAAWVKKHGQTGRWQEAELRQVLFEYEKNSQASLDFIRRKLGLHFDHQREQVKPEVNLPTALDPTLIGRERLTARELRELRHLEGFEDSALEFLLAQNLNPDQRRALLARLRRPDYPGLEEMIVADLKYRDSAGFGQHGIHRQLLPEQLEACLKLLPELISHTEFIHAYVRKLRPDMDTDWRSDAAARDAYLTRLETFVRRLPASQNSLKAHVFHERLRFNQAHGRYDKGLFIEYLRLPRFAPYMNAKYAGRTELRPYHADLNADFAPHTGLQPPRNDEPLVRDYLAHFLKDAADYTEFAEYVEQGYLKALFAETKILNGVGNLEQWYALLTPEQVRALKERVELDLLPTNPEFVTADQPVALNVAVKNAATLIVRTYEINTAACYRDKREEVTTGLDLDGLVANVETVLKYDLPPFRRHVEKLEFPHIRKPGVYVIELIGNGISSRALIRKGRLSFSERAGSGGHVFSVFDEKGARVGNATLWMDGHEYKADESGEIAAPYSTEPRRQKIVIQTGDFATLHEFDHQAETYELTADFYAERETLLADRTCRLVVRPQLRLNGVPVDVALLEEPLLSIQTTDLDGISSDQQVPNFRLFNNRESIHEFRVPERVANIRFALQGKVKNVSRDKKEDLSAGHGIALNQIETTDKLENLLLRRAADGFTFCLWGRTGEPKADRAVHFTFKHRDFRETVPVTLKTDPQGRIRLGELRDITQFAAQAPEGTSHTFVLPPDSCSRPAVVHAAADEPILVAWMDPVPQPVERGISLLEVRDGTFVRDCRDKATFESGCLVLRGLAPGDYSLFLKPQAEEIPLRVTQGRRDGAVLVGRDRILERGGPAPLQMVVPEVTDKELRVRLVNATPSTRVHMTAVRFRVNSGPWEAVRTWRDVPTGLVSLAWPESDYVSGRNIGDEYRYILDRKYAAKFPGNMLARPSLLLNPWSLRKTDTRPAEPLVMKGLYGSRSPGARGAAVRQYGGAAGPGGAEMGVFPVLEFLPSVSVVLTNLAPDKEGLVVVSREVLGAGQEIQILAVNSGGYVHRRVCLPEKAETWRDLRLAKPLDPTKHLTEQKKTTWARPGQPFVVEDIRTSQVEVYDSLERVYGLLNTLEPDPTFEEFRFVLRWPEMADAEKRKMYSKYACHELSFFLRRKDPAFFQSVIRPYLANKKDKTFLDRWLMEEDLAAYRKPWAYGRLNMVERILWAQRVPSEAGAAARHLRDLQDLVPDDVEQFNAWFLTALKGRALELGDTLGIATTREKLLKAEEETETRALRRVARAEGKAPLSFEAVPAAVTLPPPSPVAPGPAIAGGKEIAMELDDLAEADAAKDGRRRDAGRAFFRRLDKTEEWVENNYYRLPIEQQVGSLVPVNRFWRDYAAHDGKGPFVSVHVAESARNFTEKMLALAVLDLPFKGREAKSEFKGATFTLTPAGESLVYHKEMRPAGLQDGGQVLLVTQNFFARDDRYRHEGNERFDKFVTEEFRIARVYGAQVVLTNPTSARRKVEVLLQVPAGALPVLKGIPTRSVSLQLEPYSTQTLEYSFYFPHPGTFAHYPVHVAQNEKVVGFSAPFVFNVVESLTKVDRESWAYVSQYGTDDEVVRFLERNNADRLELQKIAFRMRDRAFFEKILALLEARHVYDETLWSYGIHHNFVPAIREYLQYSPLAQQCGAVIETPILTLDPVARHAYQHREYWPLVNARAFTVGKERKIRNAQFRAQYIAFLECLRYKAGLNDDERMTAAVYLLLQDRVADALAFFAKVNPAGVHTRMQYDYLKAYLAFSQEKPAEARKLAEPYKDHPVERWRNLFGEILAQADEIEGKGARVVDGEDRTQKQTQLADTSPGLEFDVENRALTIRYQNLTACRVNFYLMDIEFLFSRNPFVQEVTGQFSVIRPNDTVAVDLAKGGRQKVVDLPEKYRDRNVMIEIVGEGVRRTKAYYPHSLGIQVLENYGQVRVTHQKTGRPLAKVYVKVYARMKGGQVEFYKDGFTDLRGRFDYASLNTNEIENVDRFSILILSEDDGAVVREAAPPKM